jgi:DNA-directed RNA polymerase sigma subunit (sigma70/sigma32)
VLDLDAIRAIPDDVERIRVVNGLIADRSAEVAELSGITRETVQRMRKTMSLAQVAQALGVSRVRVQQLEKPTLQH